MTEKQQNEIFNSWLEAFKGIFFKIIRAYATTPDDQDDLFQEAALQVWRSVPKFKKKSAASTWIYRVVLNTAIKWTAKERKHGDSHVSVETKEYVIREREAPHDDRVDWLYREISKLDEVDRSLALLLLDGFSYKEMADMIGISPTNIGVRIHRIKKHLTEQSEKYHKHEV